MVGSTANVVINTVVDAIIDSQRNETIVSFLLYEADTSL